MIFCSIGAFHSETLIKLVIMNVRRFIGCQMIVHVSNTLLKVENSSDVIVNPKSLHVSRHGPEVFKIHLSNFKIVQPFAQANDKFLILPGNAIFLRKCPELSTFDMSFVNDEKFYKDSFFTPFYKYLKHHQDNVLKEHPLVRMQHEGMFFKFNILSEIMKRLEHSNLIKHCPVRPCTLEEILIPSILFQQFRSNITNFTKPLIYRDFTWSMHNMVQNTTSCGIKIIHDNYEKYTQKVLFKMHTTFETNISSKL